MKHNLSEQYILRVLDSCNDVSIIVSPRPYESPTQILLCYDGTPDLRVFEWIDEWFGQSNGEVAIGVGDGTVNITLINTLKDFYISMSPKPEVSLDGGRLKAEDHTGIPVVLAPVRRENNQTNYFLFDSGERLLVSISAITIA